MKIYVDKIIIVVYNKYNKGKQTKNKVIKRKNILYLQGGINMKIFDVETNNLASEYVADNFQNLQQRAIKWGISEQNAHDLMMDVYIRLRKKEENGNSFDIFGGKHQDIMTIKTYVVSMMKGYSKNAKYRGNTKEIFVNPIVETDDDEVMTLAEKAYMYAEATDYNEIDAVDESLFDMRDEMDYVISFTDKINIKAILKNWSALANNKLDLSILKPLRMIIKANDEFAESFLRVIKFREENRVEFDRLLACF